MVTLTHPSMPGRGVEVADARVRHFERSGWQRKTKRDKKPVVVEKPAEPVPASNTEGEAR